MLELLLNRISHKEIYDIFIKEIITYLPQYNYLFFVNKKFLELSQDFKFLNYLSSLDEKLNSKLYYISLEFDSMVIEHSIQNYILYSCETCDLKIVKVICSLFSNIFNNDFILECLSSAALNVNPNIIIWIFDNFDVRKNYQSQHREKIIQIFNNLIKMGYFKVAMLIYNNFILTSAEINTSDLFISAVAYNSLDFLIWSIDTFKLKERKDKYICTCIFQHPSIHYCSLEQYKNIDVNSLNLSFEFAIENGNIEMLEYLYQEYNPTLNIIKYNHYPLCTLLEEYNLETLKWIYDKFGEEIFLIQDHLIF